MRDVGSENVVCPWNFLPLELLELSFLRLFARCLEQMFSRTYHSGEIRFPGTSASFHLGPILMLFSHLFTLKVLSLKTLELRRD